MLNVGAYMSRIISLAINFIYFQCYRTAAANYKYIQYNGSVLIMISIIFRRTDK